MATANKRTGSAQASNRQLLNLHADKIEMVLVTHQAAARVWGGRLTPRTIQFHLAPAAKTNLAQIEALTEEIALALEAVSARLTQANGTLSLEVPRLDSLRFVSLVDLNLRLQRGDELRHITHSAGTAILGLDDEGVPLLLRLSSPNVARCLIAGATGSGKTELARTIIASLVMNNKPRDVRLALFASSLTDYTSFFSAKHLMFPVTFGSSQILERMQDLVSEIEKRSQHNQQDCCIPRIVIVVDEVTDLLQKCGDKLMSLLAQIAQGGQNWGVSVVVCVQKPSTPELRKLMDSAVFPVHIVGRVESPQDALVAAGIKDAGVERLAGYGDFVLVAAGQIIRFQAAKMDVNFETGK